MRTALAIFTRSIREDARRKRILPHLSHAANEQLIAHLHRQTTVAAEGCGLPLVVIDTVQQHGRSFGERIHNAFATTFDAGFDRVLLIGTDGAECTPKALKEAVTSVINQDQTAILGPDRRGGAWLIGLEKETFSQLDLQRIPWHTSEVFGALQKAIERLNVSVIVAQEMVDINHSHDLHVLISRIGHETTSKISELIHVVRSLLTRSFLITPSAPAKKNMLRSTPSFRGPPWKPTFLT